LDRIRDVGYHKETTYGIFGRGTTNTCTFVFVGRLHPAVDGDFPVDLIKDFVGSLLPAREILTKIV
jgi:hypothetical protein